MAKMASIKSLFMSREMWACSHTKTKSFRMAAPDVHGSLGSSLSVDSDTVPEIVHCFESEDWSAPSTSQISSSEDCSSDRPESVEGLVRGLCSQRFFFEPDCSRSFVERDSSCLLKNEEKKNADRSLEGEIDHVIGSVRVSPCNGRSGDQKTENNISCDCERELEETGGSVLDDEETAFMESLLMSLDSEDPYTDFRVSMEEMIDAYGFDNWACLEEMLTWYLKLNGKSVHGYIVGAFVDLLLSLVSERYFDHNQDDDVGQSLQD